MRVSGSVIQLVAVCSELYIAEGLGSGRHEGRYLVCTNVVKLCHANFFYISLTVHLGIILVNKQLEAHFSKYLFSSLLYMFRATQCSSSGESNCINTSSGTLRCDIPVVRVTN